MATRKKECIFLKWLALAFAFAELVDVKYLRTASGGTVAFCRRRTGMWDRILWGSRTRRRGMKVGRDGRHIPGQFRATIYETILDV